ncbi:MAG: enoyl-CoA hydratase/carnithine racemase [Kangiellaceae bacterium]|jgi:enoyl-CoA hydratase/carnithine racemase
MTDKIIISVLKTQCDLSLGCITLHKPKALNALDLDMVQAIQVQLNNWRNDASIGAVFIDSEGDRAFCAGGDIVSMYQSMAQQQKDKPNSLPDFMAQFFEQEYRLDYAIHAYPKPIVCWGNGIIMGGGLGIFAGASHKIVTETARVAMPEITIGLFPDVGASYFLNKMPQGVGKFLALSAASINAVDCISIGLADAFMPHHKKQALLLALAQLNQLNENSISTTISVLHKDSSTEQEWASLSGKLTPLLPLLSSLASLEDMSEIDVFFTALNDRFPDVKIVQKALQSFRHGSPITAKLILEQLKRAQSLSLAQCFQMELSMAYQCSIVGEFQEGVRALLIDKDNQPKWKYSLASEVPSELINAHFERFRSVNVGAHAGNNSDSEKSINPLQSLAQEYGEHHA